MDRDIGSDSDSNIGGDEARRVAILDAAGALFVSRGFQATTTLEVARRARVSKRDLYRLFPSKQDLLNAMVAHHSRAMLLPPDLPEPEDRAAFLDSLAQFGERMLSRYLAPRRIAYMRLAAAEAARSTALGTALIDNGARPVRDSVDRFLAAAVRRGILDAADADLVRDAFLNTLVGPYVLFVVVGARPVPDEAEIADRSAQAVAVVRRLLQPPGPSQPVR